jgi:hypothetical protein
VEKSRIRFAIPQERFAGDYFLADFETTTAKGKEIHLSRIVHYEFMGSWLLFWLLCVSGIGIPFAILYLLEGIIRTDIDVDDPGAFLEAYRSGKLDK